MSLIPLSDPRHAQNASSATAGFDDPRALLHACHERVQERCHLLEKLLRHTASHGADEQAQNAVNNILRYFETAAAHHHEDEERHLFPRLLASGDDALVQCAKTLQQQHHEMALAWKKLRPLLIAVQQGHANALLQQTAFVDFFVTLYRSHIALEENLAFPASFSGMSIEQHKHMGEEMAIRRGATPPKMTND